MLNVSNSKLLNQSGEAAIQHLSAGEAQQLSEDLQDLNR
jgi:hypothetical protein